ncbi:MAG: hypothetical protein HN509_11935, partial [Halobacteriovoraceae bacterium]|nr:hypothetical protein [Halobacteriovoraceae bacterium]
LFGSYIVGSHAYKKHKSQNPQDDEYYPDTESSPYEDDYEGGGEYDDGAPPDDGRWSQLWEEQRHQIIWGSQLIKKASRDERPLFYMNFVKYQF